MGYSTWTPHADLEPLGFYLYQAAWQYPLAASLLSMLMVVFQALWANSLSHQIKFSAHTSYLTAFIYLLFAGTFQGYLMTGPAIIAGFIVLGVFQTMINAYYQRNMYRNIFHAALLAGIGALFYWPLLGLWLFVLIGLIVYRDITVRKILLAILGLLPPLAGVMLYHYSLHSEDQYFYWMGQAMADWHISLDFSVPEVMLFALLSIFLILSAVLISYKSGERIMSTQRFIVMINWYFGIAILLGGLGQDLKQHMMLLFLPIALYLGSVIEKMKKKYFFEMALWLYILLLVIYRFEDEIQRFFGIELSMFSNF